MNAFLIIWLGLCAIVIFGWFISFLRTFRGTQDERFDATGALVAWMVMFLLIVAIGGITLMILNFLGTA